MVSFIPLRCICLLWLLAAVNTWAAPVDINNDLGRLVSKTYHRVAKPTLAPSNLASIRKELDVAYQAQDFGTAFSVITNNDLLHSRYFEDPDLQPVIQRALQLYCQSLVEELLIEAKQQANRLAEARLTFELARFHADNDNWPIVIHLLSDDSLFDQLSKEDVAEAYVLFGTALQKQKKHREAIRIYEKVSANSKHFRMAQLNLASAYLRQDWWTDAHSAINAALKENQGKRDALDYRLYTMLGFSQIQFGFYRDARESFRNVAISSEYAQRALLGLGIAALNQQDFIGALNAFDKLRTQPKQDISVAEAHLLSAFSLRQLEQFDAATNRYQEAIEFYQNLSDSINAQIEAREPGTVTFLRTEHSTDKFLRNNARKLLLLEAIIKTNPEMTDTAMINRVKSSISTQTNKYVVTLLRKEKEAIDSYLSQSQFGLASLYDKK